MLITDVYFILQNTLLNLYCCAHLMLNQQIDLADTNSGPATPIISALSVHNLGLGIVN